MTETLVPRPGNGSAGGSSVSTWNSAVPSGSTLVELAWTPDTVTRTRKVAILGFSETVKDAPVNDPTWELWAMNGFHRAAKPDFGIDIPEERYSAWFDTHSQEYTKAYGVRAGIEGKQDEWLRKEHPFPIYMLDAYAEYPSSVAYPLQDVIASAGRDYFTSTVAYAIALATAMPDVGEIGLWGIDLVHDTEYVDQRPCAEYHLAKAEAKGIKVTTHPRSALMKQLNRYGYEEPNPLAADIVDGLTKQRDMLVKTLNEDQGKLEAIRYQIATNDGARQVCEMLLERLKLYRRGGRI